MDPKARRAHALLVAGMLAGIAGAAWTLVAGTGPAGLPDDAAARVNDRRVARDEWRRAVAAVESDRRTPLTAADRRHILERLVEEELLVQHGIALGLIEHDRRLRGQLVADVIAAAAGGAPEPDEAALRRFYDENRELFTTPGRVRVAAARADGAPLSPPVPDALLPPAKLREYLGPRLTEVALALGEGEASAPLEGAVVRVLQKEPARTPAFEDIREEVRAAARRRAEEQALRELLAELRADGHVVVRGDGP
jgi:hypothetical protein